MFVMDKIKMYEMKDIINGLLDGTVDKIKCLESPALGRQ
jgi:hypothetical protein